MLLREEAPPRQVAGIACETKRFCLGVFYFLFARPIFLLGKARNIPRQRYVTLKYPKSV
jgi:hypothetical protein